MNMDILSILLAVFWLCMGVLMMRYANYMTKMSSSNAKPSLELDTSSASKTYGKLLSYVSLLLFLNGALAAYITEFTIGLMVTLGLALVGGIVLVVGHWKIYKSYMQ